MFQCENCDEYFDYKPLIGGRSGLRQFCSEDCLNDAEDKEKVFDGDMEFLLDNDHSMDY